jgi:peptide/nickel transport system permease protein
MVLLTLEFHINKGIREMTSTSVATTNLTELTDKQRTELDQFQPMWKIVLSQFFEHRAAVIGLVVISCFILIALSAPLITRITGLDPERQNALHRYMPIGTTVAVSQDQRDDMLTRYLKDSPGDATAIHQELVSKGLITAPELEEGLHEIVMKEPSEALDILKPMTIPEVASFQKMISKMTMYHWLGTDELGRDVLIRLVYGTRISMGVGVMVALSASLIGLLIGAMAGYYGGLIDTALMRLTDSLLSLPILPIQIVIAAIDMNKIPWLGSLMGSANQSMYKLVFILVLFSWMTVALLVRGSILSLREREFILASKTLGARDSTIIFRHMFPNVVAPMLVSVTLGVGESILWEAALSYLGLGIQQPTPSWGNMLFNAQDLMTEAPFLAILPGLLILATTISFNYLGDGLQDAIDPKAIRR